MWMCGCQPQITYWNLYAARVHPHNHVIQVDVDVWLPAPDYILKLVCCSCSSAQLCHSSRCGCVDTSPRLHTETCMLLMFICTAMSFKQMWMCSYQPQITYWNLYAARVHLHNHVIQVDVDVWLPAPDYILKLVCCSCSSAQPCHSSRCGCVATSLRLHTETCMLLVFICTTMSFK